MALMLTIYDGADCIGGNKILLEDGNAAFLLDFGTNFKAEGMYFDEFLNPRPTFGFSDLLALGILPPLKGFYRSDLEYPGVWEKYSGHPFCREVEVQGVFLSNAHYDHCGHFSYLRDDLPVFTSLTSALTCKTLQDTGGGARLQEICYTVHLEFKDGLLKVTDYRRGPHEQRPYQVFSNTGTVSADASTFWGRCDGSRGLNCRPLVACCREAEIAGLTVRFWPVDHSIPCAGAFGIKTSAGWVVYTGDLRLHGKHADLTRQFISEAAALKPAVLLCEGTHPQTEKPVTEDEVLTNSLEAVKKADGLVVADFGPRNVERLLSFLEIAEETDRQFVLTPKDIYLLEALRAAGEPGVPDPHADERIMLYVRPKTVRQKWEEALLERFKARSSDRVVVDAQTVHSDQRRYILCFSYYDFHALLDIEPCGGTYIYSSSEAFDEEMLIDHQCVRNWIDFFSFKLYGNLERDREKSGFHASGHIHGPGLEELVETVKSEILIPVHTEDRDFFRRFEGPCRVVFPRKGALITA